MSTENTLFVVAAKKKYRFATGKGYVTVEDLFDLSLESLDQVAIALDEKIQKAGRKSFVAKRSESTTEETNKLEIVKFVIETRQAEAEEKKARADKAAKKARLEALILKKKEGELEGLSVADLEKELAALG